tara:strand:- start:233 stop:1387 length:1155 start_codon:yes stop_codon:yes gene_type:complete
MHLDDWPGNSSDAALRCLRLTTPTLHLRYPLDAEAHYEEIRTALAPWRQDAPGFQRHSAAGYNGPWLENAWISHFEQRWKVAHARGQPLHSVFGSLIPIMLPWTDLWVRNNFHYPAELLPALRKMLRPSVPYVTVVQNDEGLEGKGELKMASVPNILVISSGGYGHVPVPLLKQSESPRAAPPMRERPLFVSFLGSLGTAPHNLRARMRDAVASAANTSHFEYSVTMGLKPSWASLLLPWPLDRLVSWYAGKPSWRDVMSHSQLSLCPRGFGRSSYHLSETVQMGRVPLYVYDDTAWVPYERLFKQEIGLVVDVDGLDALLRHLHAAPGTGAELEKRERAALRLRKSHFSLDGVITQIGRFLTAPHSADLQCRPLPPSRCGGCG